MKTIAKNQTVKEVYELKPRLNHPKSFHGKANVIVTDKGYKLLQSYETIVCVISPKGKFYRTWDSWSATTAKHIDSFCATFGKGYGYTKADWKGLPVYISGVRPFPCILEEWVGTGSNWANPTGYLEKFKFLGAKG